ncbi:MAG: folylpolyglutamate synthase/dihydrofolate synthase family protein [Verrucomicrobiota bacterium]|nr:folylpolyglutamate synthase/dihydrofolate synthase family protein [Verrucomicrobiota bacterium]
MTYAEAIQSLYDLQMFGTSMGLERTRMLAAAAGNPQEGLRFIHVAGTNGKGSTCAMLESIYRAAGLKVGLYTSPHLVSFRERMQCNRILISEGETTELVELIQPHLGALSEHPTFFEVVTIMAAIWFQQKKCDLVIWETGLGGRLDATNIVTPLASVITNVQYDHTKWLGETLPEIAKEKAGIIKKGVPVITACDGEEVLEVIRKKADEMEAPLKIVSPEEIEKFDYSINLQGNHQRKNGALALQTVRTLQHLFPVTEKAVRQGFATVEWQGRFEHLQLKEGQELIIDGAHNEAGVLAFVETVNRTLSTTAAERALIIGILNDKPVERMIPPLAQLANVICCVKVRNERSSDPAFLAKLVALANPKARVELAETANEALNKVRGHRQVLVTGSLYFIGEFLQTGKQRLVVDPLESNLNHWGSKRSV